MSKTTQNCDCDFCKNNHEVILGKELLHELMAEKVTIFAGAGISTESRSVLKTTFYESVADELDLEQPALDFPELMENYCHQPNGRFKLLNKIKNRFDHIDSFPELNRRATLFHRELGTFFPVKNIITTNWDTYFEEYCKATPFVTDSDLAFWEAAERRVLKIHGSITNFGSIVATTKDYRRSQNRLNKGLIGGLLKTILATQTIIFIGYSLSDTDFAAIYRFVTQQMKTLQKQPYVVTPFAEEGEKFRKAGFIPIVTDGRYFLQQIKSHAVAKKLMLSDEIYTDAEMLLQRVLKEHHLLSKTIKAINHPQVIYALSYQDGLMHSLERAIQMQGSGQYSHECKVRNTIRAYLEILQEKRQIKSYSDVAYVEGYLNGLIFLLLDKADKEETTVPFYFMFGIKSEIGNLGEYINCLKTNPDLHKASLKQAQEHLKRLSQPESVIFHHPPWL